MQIKKMYEHSTGTYLLSWNNSEVCKCKKYSYMQLCRFDMLLNISEER